MKEFLSAIEQVCEEKGISKEKVMETVEMAIAAAYKKDHGLKGLNIRAVFDEKIGGFNVFQAKTVIDPEMVWSEEELAQMEKERAEKAEAEPAEVDFREREREFEEEETLGGERKIRFNEEKHLFPEEAKKLKFAKSRSEKRTTEEGEQTFTVFVAGEKGKKAKAGKKQKEPVVGDEIWFALDGQEDYGRIAAQTAKQVVIQRIREAEREAIFDEYKEREGEVMAAAVQRIERNVVFVDIGKASGVLFPEDQIPGEYYRIGQRLRVYLAEVRKDAKGPAIVVSRTRPEMLKRLFEMEVPEIVAGSVDIKAVAREAGARSKIAISSNEEGVDPIGACVGQRGTRVQAVINELGGEKIDIIEWSENPEKFVANALSPAKVINVEIDEAERTAKVQVPDDQLSLAIGKRGQNVRLAAKLTGWRIDVLTDKKEEVLAEEAPTEEEKAPIEDAAEESKTSKEKKKKKKPAVGEDKPAKKEKKTKKKEAVKEPKIEKAKKKKKTEK